MASSPRLYRIHRHRLSHIHKFEIYNGNDELLYNVQSIPSSRNEDLSLTEASSETELIRAKYESHHFRTSYSISAPNTNHSNDGHLGTLHRVQGDSNETEITSIYGVYAVRDVDGPADHEFRLTTGNATVAKVSRDPDTSKPADMYEVQISDDDGGDLFLLALVVVFWCAQQRVHSY